MAISITAGSTNLAGKVYEPILEELLFENKTVGKELVAFDDQVKSSTEITEISTTVAMQAYTSGAPSSSGTLTSTSVVITPVKVMFYQEFDPNTLRPSRYGRDMKAGAWNTASTEFEKIVLGSYAKKVSYTTEAKFWNNALAATQTAVAALTPGTGQGNVGAAEQAYVAAVTAGQFDGVVTRMIYNNAALGTRIKVAGTTLSNSNIKTEIAKVYNVIPSVVINDTNEPAKFFMPYSTKQFILEYNNTVTNYKDAFIVEGLGTANESFYYNGLKIEFVPLPENCIIAAKPSHILWATDLVSDLNYMQIDKIANNRDDMFVKHVFTIFAHVMNQSYNVLYLG